MNNIVIIGAGGHASACIDVIEMQGDYKIAGLVDNMRLTSKSGYPIIGNDDDLPDLRKKYDYALIAIGQIKSPNLRKNIFNLLNELKFILPVIISPKSYVSKNSNIKSGSVIMHDVVINAGASIGYNCIINSKTLIEHDVSVGNNCHISTGAIINGGVSIGDNNFIGSGVVTRQNINIANNCIIGAGKVLMANVKSNEVLKN
mgnify:CR=1 FL=1